MQQRLVVATHPGTGLQVVKSVVEDVFNGQLVVVTTPDEAADLPFDRLILLGGADIAPHFYGERDRYCDGADKRRDTIEWLLVRRALTDRIPTLGICRGHQMLAVAAGGALYQDMKRQARKRHEMTHPLQHIMPALDAHLPTHKVNSLHHQAVKRVPFGFKVAATAHDGIVESIYTPGFLGVQWHPELLVGSEQKWLDLFHWWYAYGLSADKH